MYSKTRQPSWFSKHAGEIAVGLFLFGVCASAAFFWWFVVGLKFGRNLTTYLVCFLIMAVAIGLSIAWRKHANRWSETDS
ncbi:MAG TPA: hypothetical protein VMQ44_00510 [Candidatus Saccharimonadales bacterium]|nr:hypothetical protein [Candidatus Saccharimonadales bacterium]